MHKVKKRSYADNTERLLYAVSAGRCQAPGCNRFTLRHPVTQQDGNFSQKGHIIAFGKKGPRSQGSKPKDINGFDNLMLFCADCHKRVDELEKEYTEDGLKQFKRAHEARIFHLTGLGTDIASKPMVLLANIGQHAVSISDQDIYHAFGHQRYASCKIDPINFVGFVDDASWYPQIDATLKSRIPAFYREPGAGARPAHVSVFAFGPIPLLVRLGSTLSNKVPTAFYQKHRDTDTWQWKAGPATAQYQTSTISKGKDVTKVALVLSLSGKIHVSTAGIPDEFSVYEITVSDGVNGPHRDFLKSEEDLNRFRDHYRKFVSQVCADHPGVTEIHLYPAIPAPVAVICGFELLPKVHPDIVVYDADKNKGGFYNALTVKREELYERQPVS